MSERIILALIFAGTLLFISLMVTAYSTDQLRVMEKICSAPGAGCIVRP